MLVKVQNVRKCSVWTSYNSQHCTFCLQKMLTNFWLPENYWFTKNSSSLWSLLPPFYGSPRTLISKIRIFKWCKRRVSPSTQHEGMKWSGGTAPLVLDFGTTWIQVVSLTPLPFHSYPPGGSQVHRTYYRTEETHIYNWIRTPDHPASSTTAVMTALPWSADSWKFLNFTSCLLASDDVIEFQTMWGWVRRTKIIS